MSYISKSSKHQRQKTKVQQQKTTKTFHYNAHLFLNDITVSAQLKHIMLCTTNLASSHKTNTYARKRNKLTSNKLKIVKNANQEKQQSQNDKYSADLMTTTSVDVLFFIPLDPSPFYRSFCPFLPFLRHLAVPFVTGQNKFLLNGMSE